MWAFRYTKSSKHREFLVQALPINRGQRCSFVSNKQSISNTSFNFFSQVFALSLSLEWVWGFGWLSFASKGKEWTKCRAGLSGSRSKESARDTSRVILDFVQGLTMYFWYILAWLSFFLFLGLSYALVNHYWFRQLRRLNFNFFSCFIKCLFMVGRGTLKEELSLLY